jgi:hypothetical protein
MSADIPVFSAGADLSCATPVGPLTLQSDFMDGREPDGGYFPLPC